MLRRHGTLGGGVLTGRYKHGEAPAPDSRMGRLLGHSLPGANRWARSLLNERNLDVADELVKVAAELGATPAEVALAWVARRPGVTSVLIGPRSVEQLRENLAAFDLDLPEEAVARLDEISHRDLGPMDGSFFHLVPR
ncbi:aldo/keto reductase [Nonomuraea sp. NPDC050451]|uniref:aldo/keto reductase n=1 Tax=Nonomuraea sp. NPDC050451 TaxID=3364364 RepID=UPI0037989C34